VQGSTIIEKYAIESTGSYFRDPQVHLFTHGFGPTSNCTEGVQCQNCAKFATFDSEPVGESGLPALKALIAAFRCECGGTYVRDKPIMCPRCKSVNVEYGMEMIT
jgi:hypothetical protein